MKGRNSMLERIWTGYYPFWKGAFGGLVLFVWPCILSFFLKGGFLFYQRKKKKHALTCFVVSTVPILLAISFMLGVLSVNSTCT